MAEENSTTNEENNFDKNDNAVKGIRTFEDDIANYTKEKNFSILDIAAEEAKVRSLRFPPAVTSVSLSPCLKEVMLLIISFK